MSRVSRSRARRITAIHTNPSLKSAIGLLASLSDKNGFAPTPKHCAATIGIRETKFIHGEATDSGHTRRRHVFVDVIEDIGKEADKWDDEEPLTADSEFTVSYGVSETDRSTMLAVIRSVSKRRLARAAKVSTRSIPSDEAAANEMRVKEFRRLFDVACSLRDDDRNRQVSDLALVRWISERGRAARADGHRGDVGL